MSSPSIDLRTFRAILTAPCIRQPDAIQHEPLHPIIFWCIPGHVVGSRDGHAHAGLHVPGGQHRQRRPSPPPPRGPTSFHFLAAQHTRAACRQWHVVRSLTTSTSYGYRRCESLNSNFPRTYKYMTQWSVVNSAPLTEVADTDT